MISREPRKKSGWSVKGKGAKITKDGLLTVGALSCGIILVTPPNE